jgi:hypothetical protein
MEASGAQVLRSRSIMRASIASTTFGASRRNDPDSAA